MLNRPASGGGGGAEIFGAVSFAASASGKTRTPPVVTTTPPLATPLSSGLRTSTVFAIKVPLDAICVSIATGAVASDDLTMVEMRPGCLCGIVITSLPSTTWTVEPGALRTGWPFATPTDRPAGSTAAALFVPFASITTVTTAAGSGACVGSAGAALGGALVVWPGATSTVLPLAVVATRPSVVVTALVPSLSRARVNAVPRTEAVAVGVRAWYDEPAVIL